MDRLKAGDRVSGFTVRSIRFVRSVNTTVYRLIHRATKFEVVHLANDDMEKMFSFVVNTPCSDDTGVAHILEHSVLSGSKRFPLKDPFVQLLKGSMKTFMNASTGMDETQYYAASTNETDFTNLMRVYGDAIFFPLLREEVFMQEGIRIEVPEADGKPGEARFAGVVYNEMTGKFSHPESTVSDFSIRSLFPDNEYRFESGGDPLAMTDLTYDAFIGYYRRFYHPSNMKLCIYGDLDTVKVLSFLEGEFLSGFKAKRVKAGVTPQRKWGEPRVMEKAYPVAEADTRLAKSYVSLNWLTGPSVIPAHALTFELLNEILVGNPGSPLRKALQESGLGEDILPSTGLAGFLEDLIFSVGLRGSGILDARRIDMLVTGVLTDLVKNGIGKQIVEAALNRIEFRNRESNLDGNYRGIRLFNKIIRPWTCGIEPHVTLDFDRWLSKLKATLAKNHRYLEGYVDKYLLRNSHRSLIIIKPDPGLAERTKALLSLRLSAATGSADAMAEIRKANAKFTAFQDAQDSALLLESIPTLRVEDLPKSPPHIPIEEIKGTGLSSLLFHDIFTNGIVYIDFAFDVSDMDPGLFRYVILFGKAVSSCGIPGMTYDRVAQELSLLTGGFHVSFDTDYVCGTRSTRSILVFRLKVLESALDKALALVVALFSSADFGNRERIKDMLFELRNRHKSSVTPAGNYYASVRAGSRIAHPFMIEETVNGLSQAGFLASLLTDPDAGVTTATGELYRMRGCVFSKEQLVLNVTCDRELFEKTRQRIIASVESLQVEKQQPVGTRGETNATGRGKLEAIAYPSGVSFNAVALAGSPYEEDANALETVLAHFISTDFLWEKVRQKGGAYGAHASVSGMASAFVFSSYRDPNIADTLSVFRESLEYIRNGSTTEEEVAKAIIGTVANSEKPSPPGDKAIISLKRKLYRISDELRQKRRDMVLGCTVAALAKAAEHLLSKYDEGYTVVIASREKLLEEASRMPGLNSDITDLAI